MTKLMELRAALMSLFILASGCMIMHSVSYAQTVDGGVTAENSMAGKADAAPATLSDEDDEDRVTTDTSDSARDPRAEEMILNLARHASARKIFRFKFVDTFDDIQPDGRKIQITHVRQGVISRPDRFIIVTTGDVANRSIYDDGTTVTVWDRDENIYAQIANPGNVNQALDMLMDRYHMAVPAADLLYDDPAKSFLEQMTISEYVGPSTVDEIQCHHLSCTGRTFDWQVWIKTGEAPALLKMVIDYKNLPGRPQYTLRILSMEPLEAVDAAEFQFVVPKDAERVEMQPVSEIEKQ